jgi:hypothetical protein
MHRVGSGPGQVQLASKALDSDHDSRVGVLAVVLGLCNLEGEHRDVSRAVGGRRGRSSQGQGIVTSEAAAWSHGREAT